jgi:hypothetical protein
MGDVGHASIQRMIRVAEIRLLSPRNHLFESRNEDGRSKKLLER